MRRSLAVAALAAATLLAGGATGTANASESPSPTDSASAAPDVATPLERVRALTQPSIVYVETEYESYVYDRYNKEYINNGLPVKTGGSCTGFVVTPDGYIATAGHCVNIPEIGEYMLYQRAAELAIEQGYYVDKTLTVDQIIGFDHYIFTDQSGRRQKPKMKVSVAWSQSAGGVQTSKGLPARVVKWQNFNEGDGAILKVEETGLNALPLAENSLEVGTDVITIGYPGSINTVADPDFTPSFKEGSVSSQKTVGGGLTSVWEISAETSKGMSGGPTVNLDGEVVGVISFHPPTETQSFNFIQPTSVIEELLGDAGQQNVLSEDTQAYRAGLAALFSGDKETAVSNLSEVQDNQPTNELAKEYLDQAQDLPDPVTTEEDSGDEDSGSNMGLIIGIVVGLLVLAAIVGALVLLLSRNKKKGSTSAPTSGPAYGGPPPGTPAYQQQPGMGTAPGATGTAVLSPPSSPAGPSASSTPAPSTPPPAPAPAPAAETAAQPQVEEDVFCQNCGTKGEPHQKFCKHCGSPL